MHKKNATRTTPARHIKRAFASTCVAIFFFLPSCVSNNESDNGLYETYTTFELFFTFSYPKTWSIFEHENNVAFSNSVALLTTPKDERIFTPRSFLGSLYLSDLSAMRVIHGGISKQALFLSLSRDGTFGNIEDKKAISITKLQKLSDVISGDAYASVQGAYQRAFKVPLSNYARGYTVGESVLIVDSFLKADAPSNSQQSATETRETIIIRAVALRKITNEIFATSVSLYHTALSPPMGEQDLLLAIARETQHQVFLQNLVNTVQSVQVNAPVFRITTKKPAWG